MSKGKEKVNVPGLPKPWLAYASSRYEGRVFYYNPETRESRWDVPENRTPSLAVRLSTKNASSEVCFNKKTIEGRRSIQIPKKRGTSKKKRSNREDAPSSTVVHPSDVKSPVIRRHQQYVHQMSQSFDKKILMKMKEKSNFSLSEDSANLSLSTGKSFSHNQTTTGAVFVPHDSVKHLPQKCPNKPSAFENVSSKASNARGSDKKISQKLAVGSCHASTSSIKQTIKEPGNDVCFDMGTKRQSVKTKVFQRKNSVSNSRAILDEEELEDYNKAVSRLPPSVTNDSSIKNEAACVKNVCSDKGKFANKTASALERNTKNVFHQMTITQNFSEVKNFVANKPTMNVIRDTESRASEKNVSVDTELPVKSCAKKSHLEKFAQYQNQSGGKIIHNDLSASNIAQNLSMISETHSRGDTDSSTNDDNNGDAMDVDIVVPSKKIRIDDVEPMDIDYVEEITKYRNAVFLHPDEHYCETVGLKSVSDTQKQITQSSNDEVLLDAFVAVFDTSALLEDPLLLKRCVECNIFIVIPFTVVNEIDGLKKSSETSDVAKAAVAVNNSLFDLSRMRNEFLILESSMEVS
ncbi:hypothetical protein AB6A40_005972 [Gnathostoma spinigerum]|uniref:WW domain-containing protein n=1 Tax=Gnathostoma spinigerum TaxID=75299 RepID=A0ABD6EH76_9BILA